MAVGQSQSKLSQKMNEWSCHAVIENDNPMEQQTTAAANINKDKLGPPLLDNGEGKQLFLVTKHKSTISKKNGKNKQTKEQTATMMASVNEQNNTGVAEADKQASPPIQSNMAKPTVNQQHTHQKVQQ